MIPGIFIAEYHLNTAIKQQNAEQLCSAFYGIRSDNDRSSANGIFSSKPQIEMKPIAIISILCRNSSRIVDNALHNRNICAASVKCNSTIAMDGNVKISMFGYLIGFGGNSVVNSQAVCGGIDKVEIDRGIALVLLNCDNITLSVALQISQHAYRSRNKHKYCRNDILSRMMPQVALCFPFCKRKSHLHNDRA